MKSPALPPKDHQSSYSLLGLRDYQSDIALGIDLRREHWKTFSEIARGLWKAYSENDATLAEINPLVITKEKQLVALDGKMLVDDNALFRHADLAEMRDVDEEAAAETEARKYGLSFIKLDDQIGCMVNGAGLAMTTMDIVKLFGGGPELPDIGGARKKSLPRCASSFQTRMSRQSCSTSLAASPAATRWPKVF